MVDRFRDRGYCRERQYGFFLSEYEGYSFGCRRFGRRFVDRGSYHKKLQILLPRRKGYNLYLRFKPDTFVSWERITEVKCFEHGFGRSYQKNILVFNDKYSVQPLSPSDINEENYARGFLVRLSNDESFAEYLSHYRADLKIEYSV